MNTTLTMLESIVLYVLLAAVALFLLHQAPNLASVLQTRLVEAARAGDR